MIVKDIDNKNLNNKYQKSGFEAENQMGFYLKRAFKTDDYIYILNDLRLELGDDHAQIDHLIIHQFGFIIIESKSVSSKVCVNKHGEWKRIFNDKESGMPSPIQQAKRQIDFLKNFLMKKDSSEIYRENLANKYLPYSIEKFAYDVIVAISDSGIIERDEIELIEICKADSVTERISDIISKYYKQYNKLLTITVPNHFHKESVEKLANLLISSHCPVNKIKEEINTIIRKPLKYNKSTPKSKISIEESYYCKYCKSPNLEIRNGRYGFYFKCLSCDKNTKLELKCSNPIDKCKPLLKQKGLEFFKNCKACGEERLFFTNSTPKPPEKPPTSKLHQCSKCKSENVKIEYTRKLGYHYECQECNAQSKINLYCINIDCTPRIKKIKLNFYQVCPNCNTEKLFFTNKRIQE